MSSNSVVQNISNINDCLVWVLYPAIDTEDPDLKYYYDFQQSFEEYKNVFHNLGIEWKWQPVLMDQINEVISSIRTYSDSRIPIVFNLCDGDEGLGIPGISVIDALEREQLVYTGSNRPFYENTTSKIPMKRLFDEHEVPTSSWLEIDPEQTDSHNIFQRLTAPLIVKPAISAGSLGLGIKSVVHHPEELSALLHSNQRYYKQWDLYKGGVFVEEFISGPEYTVFMVGSYLNLNQCTVYPAVERRFETSLPDTQKFLSFDRLWEFYENETPLDEEKDLWNYTTVHKELQQELKELSLKAYAAVQGEGYARIDFRQDKSTQIIKVLEVNAQCGLSADENYTSIGGILRLYNLRYDDIIMEILKQAITKCNNLSYNYSH